MAGMRDIRIEKVVVNVGVGEAGEKLVKAQKVLELVTKQKSVQTLSHQAVRDWGVRRNMPIGTRVTLRGGPRRRSSRKRSRSGTIASRRTVSTRTGTSRSGSRTTPIFGG